MKYKKGDLIIEECGESFYLIVLTWIKGKKAHGYILDEVTRKYKLEGNWIVECGYEKKTFEEPYHTNQGESTSIDLDRCEMLIQLTEGERKNK